MRCVDGAAISRHLLASDGKRVIAVEAKGLESSAREKNFRQVQSWKAEVDLALTVDPEDVAENPDLKRYVEQLGLIGVAGKTADDCKGLIVIGTFRNIPLNERKMPDFPDNVTRSLIQSDVCAVTGLQLFGLVLQARSNPGSRANIVASLFETAGVLRHGLKLARVPDAVASVARMSERDIRDNSKLHPYIALRTRATRYAFCTKSPSRSRGYELEGGTPSCGARRS